MERRRRWHPTPELLPGKSHGRRSLVGCSPWGREELDMTEQLHFHFSLSCIGEGNGNPLQCSCLENPRDGGAWWAAVYGVAQNRTWLKRLSSSSSNSSSMNFWRCQTVDIGNTACVWKSWRGAWVFSWFSHGFRTRDRSPHSRRGVPNLRDLIPDDLRWTCCNHNRNNQ